MATFMIPGKAFEGVTAIGAPAPDAGFYAVTITEVIIDQKNAQKRRFRVQLPNGYRTLAFFSLTHDADGTLFQGLDDRQVRGRTAGIRSILESLGYTSSDIEGAQAITDEWFLASANGGRKAYVEFTPGQQGVEGSFSRIERWMNKSQHDALVAAGKKPAAAAPVAAKAAPAARAVAPMGLPAPVAAIPAPPVAAAPPVNGAGVPAAHASLPPAPSAAQQIIS